MRVEVLTSPGCPNAAATKDRSSPPAWPRLALDEPIIDRVGRYPSPTMLVDGVDVMRPEDERRPATLADSTCPHLDVFSTRCEVTEAVGSKPSSHSSE